MPVLFPIFLGVAAEFTVTGNLGIPVLMYSNLDGQGLRMEWECDLTLTRTANTATLRIFNLGLPQRKILEAVMAVVGFGKPPVCELKIGWDGKTFRLMQGQIWKIRPEVYEENDTVTEIEFGDGLVAMRTVTGYPKQVTLTLVQAMVASAALAMGLELDVVQATPIIASSPNAFRLMNIPPGLTPRDQMDLAASGLGDGYDWGIRNNRIVIFNRGLLTLIVGLPNIIAPESGLLSYTVETNGSVGFEAMANPGVEPGTGVSIIDRFKKPVGQPLMRVESASFSGNTHGESSMSVVARPLSLL